MKRKSLLLTTLLLTASMLFAACNTTKGTPSDQSTVQESTKEDSTVTEKEEVQDSNNLVLPKITITHHQEFEYAEDGETVVAEYVADKVALEGAGYEKAAQTIEKMFADNAEGYDDLKSIAQEDYEYRMSNGEAYFVPYSTTSTCKIARLDQNIFSIRRWTYDYTGGAHGLGAYWGTTIDLQTGEELELLDLAADSYALIEDCTNFALEELSGRTDELFPEYEPYVQENLQNCSWYLDASGIVFVFTPYEIGPYASGCIEICVPYSHIAKDMKPEYCGIQGDCIAMVQEGEKVSFTTTGGKARELIFENIQTGEYDYHTTLKVDQGENSLGDYVMLEAAYLVHNADGKTFLIYTVDWASDDFETYVYDLTGDHMIQTSNIWACLNGSGMSTDTLSLEFRLDVLGTYFSEMEYELTEEGMLRPLEDIYFIETRYTWSGLTTIKELPVIIDNEQMMLPVGTRLYIVATDNDGTAWFETLNQDGETKSGMIRYIRDAETYRIYIDGLAEDEYFDMLPYSG